MKKLLSLLCSLMITVLVFGQADEDWFHQTPSAENVYGIGTHDLYKDLLKDKKGKTVVVAIIDSGIDIEHEDLKDVVWVNTDEIPNNGKDDDNNGYVDDVNGWNFIGGKDGDVDADTYEVTRLYKKYKYKYENATPSQLSGKQKAEYENFLVYKKEVEAQQSKAEADLAKITESRANVMKSIDAVVVALDGADITQENLNSLGQDDMSLDIGKSVFMRALSESKTIDPNSLKEKIAEQFKGGMEYYGSKTKYAYNIDFNPRTIVGDNYADSYEKGYGNNGVEGPDALHGTHVGGIVAATRNNSVGMDGVADNVQLMSIRTVPNGDERDKDVANAIIYAVDNGASIINMSFGKAFSWDKEAVDKAVKYAEKKDVLLVHAAGNSGQNNDISDNFPNDQYLRKGFFKFLKKKEASNWLEIGALSYNTDENLPAPFSNYGKECVDLFAPGMAIYATVPDDEYQNLQGTSMAAPVVAGVAAILRSYFPSLSAKQVKEILMTTSTKIDQEVLIPGEDTKTNFSNLSVSGGTVNAKAAVMKAIQVTGKKPMNSRA